MAAFSKETVFSRPFGRWDLVAMVETRGSYEEAVQGAGREGVGRALTFICHRLPRAVGCF